MYITEHGGEWRGERGRMPKGKHFSQSKTKNTAPLLQLQDGLDFLSMQGIPAGKACPPPLYIKGDVSGVIAHCPPKMGATQRSEG